jgi:hypothetical protein
MLSTAEDLALEAPARCGVVRVCVWIETSKGGLFGRDRRLALAELFQGVGPDLNVIRCRANITVLFHLDQKWSANTFRATFMTMDGRVRGYGQLRCGRSGDLTRGRWVLGLKRFTHSDIPLQQYLNVG